MVSLRVKRNIIFNENNDSLGRFGQNVLQKRRNEQLINIQNQNSRLVQEQEQEIIKNVKSSQEYLNIENNKIQLENYENELNQRQESLIKRQEEIDKERTSFSGSQKNRDKLFARLENEDSLIIRERGAINNAIGFIANNKSNFDTLKNNLIISKLQNDNDSVEKIKIVNNQLSNSIEDIKAYKNEITNQEKLRQEIESTNQSKQNIINDIRKELGISETNKILESKQISPEQIKNLSPQTRKALGITETNQSKQIIAPEGAIGSGARGGFLVIDRFGKTIEVFPSQTIKGGGVGFSQFETKEKDNKLPFLNKRVENPIIKAFRGEYNTQLTNQDLIYAAESFTEKPQIKNIDNILSESKILRDIYFDEFSLFSLFGEKQNKNEKNIKFSLIESSIILSEFESDLFKFKEQNQKDKKRIFKSALIPVDKFKDIYFDEFPKSLYEIQSFVKGEPISMGSLKFKERKKIVDTTYNLLIKEILPSTISKGTRKAFELSLTPMIFTTKKTTLSKETGKKIEDLSFGVVQGGVELFGSNLPTLALNIAGGIGVTSAIKGGSFLLSKTPLISKIPLLKSTILFLKGRKIKKIVFFGVSSYAINKGLPSAILSETNVQLGEKIGSTIGSLTAFGLSSKLTNKLLTPKLNILKPKNININALEYVKPLKFTDDKIISKSSLLIKTELPTIRARKQTPLSKFLGFKGKKIIISTSKKIAIKDFPIGVFDKKIKSGITSININDFSISKGIFREYRITKNIRSNKIFFALGGSKILGQGSSGFNRLTKKEIRDINKQGIVYNENTEISRDFTEEFSLGKIFKKSPIKLTKRGLRTTKTQTITFSNKIGEINNLDIISSSSYSKDITLPFKKSKGIIINTKSFINKNFILKDNNFDNVLKTGSLNLKTNQKKFLNTKLVNKISRRLINERNINVKSKINNLNLNLKIKQKNSPLILINENKLNNRKTNLFIKQTQRTNLAQTQRTNLAQTQRTNLAQSLSLRNFGKLNNKLSLNLKQQNNLKQTQIPSLKELFKLDLKQIQKNPPIRTPNLRIIRVPRRIRIPKIPFKIPRITFKLKPIKNRKTNNLLNERKKDNLFIIPDISSIVANVTKKITNIKSDRLFYQKALSLRAIPLR